MSKLFLTYTTQIRVVLAVVNCCLSTSACSKFSFRLSMGVGVQMQGESTLNSYCPCLGQKQTFCGFFFFQLVGF
jgi:hypothetical protein